MYIFFFYDLLQVHFNSSINKEVLDLSKFKAFWDDNWNAGKIAKFNFDRGENIVGKRKNAGYQHFSFCHIIISKGLFHRAVKTLHCVEKDITSIGFMVVTKALKSSWKNHEAI